MMAINQIKLFFQSDPVNSSRQIEIDIARGFSVLFMIWIHVILAFGKPDFHDTILGLFFDFLGGPLAAPVFMFLMGAGVVFSKKATPQKLIRRGFILWLIGYLLNFLRTFLPVFLADKYSLVNWDLSQLYYNNSMYAILLEVDILQFAGIVLIFLGLLQQVKTPGWIYLVIAILISLISPYLWGRTSSIPFVQFILNHFWGTEEYVCFPFFSWIFYPIAGILFAELLIHIQNKTKFYKHVGISGLIVMIIGIIILIIFKKRIPEWESYFWRHGLELNLIILGCILIWLFIIHRISPFIHRIVYDRLSFYSRNVTTLYFLHWLLIGWSVFVMGFSYYSVWTTCFFMILFTILSDRVTALFLFLKRIQ